LCKNYKDPHGYYTSMRPEDVSRLTQIETFRMKRGDLLFFNEMLPHRAIPNHSQGIRWSIDLRYYESSSEVAMSPSRSFVCANKQPGKIDNSYTEWERRMYQPIS
jgi:ectoine hydroxylase-related dioxygenase (phytanoyl-CoA dioxygenase family)